MLNSGTLINNEVFFTMKFLYNEISLHDRLLFLLSYIFYFKGKERCLSFEGPCSVIIKNLVHEDNFLELVIFLIRPVWAGLFKSQVTLTQD